MTTAREGAMDAAARAELAALRRRAYAPDADIADDPTALARLAELEDQVRGSVPAERQTTADPAMVAEPDAHEPAPERPSIAPPRRRRWHVALIVGTAAAALILGWSAWKSSAGPAPAPTGAPPQAEFAEALAFADDPEATVLYTLRLDGAFGSYSDPYPEPPPALPIAKPFWASSLGEYYGYDLWIAGTISQEGQEAPVADEVCVVLDGTTMLSRCVPRTAWEQGALLLPLPYAEVADDERPTQMRPDQSLGIWWTADDSIRVVLGRGR